MDTLILNWMLAEVKGKIEQVVHENYRIVCNSISVITFANVLSLVHFSAIFVEEL